jgi:hypothetical protein
VSEGLDANRGGQRPTSPAYVRERWWEFRPPLDRVRELSVTVIVVLSTWKWLVDPHASLAIAIVALIAVIGLVGATVLEFGARAVERHRRDR